MFGGQGLTRPSKVCAVHAPCAAEADALPRQAPSLWSWPGKAWSRVHMDYLGPFFGKLYLVIVDAGSKWLEVFEVPSTAAYTNTHNGPPYTSVELAT